MSEKAHVIREIGRAVDALQRRMGSTEDAAASHEVRLVLQRSPGILSADEVEEAIRRAELSHVF